VGPCMKAKFSRFTVVAFLVLFGASYAFADSVTDSDIRFTATVSATTVTLDVQCVNTAVCGNWYLGDVTVKGFSFTGSPTLGTAPFGYSLENGGQNNSAVGTGGGCNGTQAGDAVCWDAPFFLTQLGGGVLVFTANITGGSPGPLSVQATGYNNPFGFQWLWWGKTFAVSDQLDPSSAAVPEPSALILLGSGLLALIVLRRSALLPS
jgi:hypothetical protein